MVKKNTFAKSFDLQEIPSSRRSFMEAKEQLDGVGYN
jgi:hypothetical protein